MNLHANINLSLALSEVLNHTDVLMFHVHDEGIHLAVILKHVIRKFIDEILLLIRRLEVNTLPYINFSICFKRHFDLLGGHS